MPMLDAFNTNVFSMISLTAAINKLPHKPKLLQTLGIFNDKSITTTIAVVEEKDGKLSLLPRAARGTIANTMTKPTRYAVNFTVPHVPLFSTVMADDVQNMRAFGSETESQMLASYINERLADMRRSHEATQEFHRMGALQGVILDADGVTVIYNLFNEFGLVQEQVDFDVNDTDFGPVCSAIIRAVAGKLGDDSFGRIYAICGNNYFDAVASHGSVKTAYDRWKNGEYLRMNGLGPEWYSVAANGFEYQNIYFINYRGTIDNVTFLPADDAYYFASGVPGLFQEIIAPGDFVETVNTMGQRFYARQEPLKFNKGVELHTQSNILAMCTRPSSVIKSQICNWPGIGSC